MNFRNITKIKLLCICIIIKINVVAQRNIGVSFGSKLYLISDTSIKVDWQVKYYNNIVLKGSSTDLNNFVFAKPGSYTIYFNEHLKHIEGTCNHPHFPDSLTVNVSPVRTIFDLTKVMLSNEIKKGVDVAGTTISVPVRLEVYQNKKINYTNTIITTAGIGTAIQGTLMRKPSYTTGNYIFTYNLTGKALEESYIMFDFVAYDGSVQSYSHLKKIF
jgi:hypothetical protein